MSVAYVALGTNLGDREQNIKSAIDALGLLPGTSVSARSAVYETAPWGFAPQGNFLNAVVRVETSLSPAALLGACLGIEAGFGRVRSVKNGPRILDLDLLLYEDVSCNTPELCLPHPRMMERAFVLRPLIDLLPEEKYRAALRRTDPAEVWPYEP